MAKVLVSMNDELLAKVDAIAKSLYMTRSAYLTMCVLEKQRNDEVVKELPRLIEKVSKE